MKIDRLFERDFAIVENKRKVFIAPVVILLLAVIACIVFRFTMGSAFNLGMDFTGGYSINVKLGDKLNDATYDSYKETAVSIAEDLANDAGEKYGIKISSVQRQGEGSDSGLLLKYQSVGTEAEMESINEQLHNELMESMFYYRATVVLNDAKTGFTATYSADKFDFLKGDANFRIQDKLSVAGYGGATVVVGDDFKSVTVTLASAVTDADVEKLTDAMSFIDDSSGSVSDGGQTSSTVSSEILKSALLAVSVALVLMLAYIVIRFELLSGIAAVFALAHDLLMMACFMAIFHVEINSTFIAAIITILGYSINNTIIIFDRVRENLALYAHKRIDGKLVKPAYIANKSVQETIWRTINTTLTTLIIIAMVAIIGVSDIRVFALPIIFGLLAGTYSSIFIAPSIWATLAKAFPGAMRAPKAKRSSARTDK